MEAGLPSANSEAGGNEKYPTLVDMTGFSGALLAEMLDQLSFECKAQSKKLEAHSQ